MLTTTEKREEAEKIARVLVEERLAGCVQIIGPITSTYWWEESINTTEEWLLLIKSRKTLYPKIEETIKKNHSYKTPEIIMTPIITGDKDYLDWLNQELRGE